MLAWRRRRRHLRVCPVSNLLQLLQLLREFTRRRRRRLVAAEVVDIGCHGDGSDPHHRPAHLQPLVSQLVEPHHPGRVPDSRQPTHHPAHCFKLNRNAQLITTRSSSFYLPNNTTVCAFASIQFQKSSRTARSDKNTNSCPKACNKTVTGYVFYHTSKISQTRKLQKSIFQNVAPQLYLSVTVFVC